MCLKYVLQVQMFTKLNTPWSCRFVDLEISEI